MLKDLTTAGAKALGGARFSLVNVVPSALLVGTVLGAAWTGAYGDGPVTLDGVTAHIKDPVQAAVVVFGLFLAGVLIQPFQLALVQVLEGYWGEGPIGRSVGALAVERHQRRRYAAVVRGTARAQLPASSQLTDLVRYAATMRAVEQVRRQAVRRQEQYPERADRVMATRLGNVLRGAEDAAGGRYGLAAITVYPRMYPSVSKSLSESMTRQLDSIAVAASMCVSFTLGAIATAPLVLRSDGWRLVPVVSVVLAIISYRGAIRAAAQHGILFATAFDLHRFDMLRALHYQLPSDAAEENRFNQLLTTFLQQRTPVVDSELADELYDHPSPENVTPPPGEPPPGDDREEDRGAEEDG